MNNTQDHQSRNNSIQSLQDNQPRNNQIQNWLAIGVVLISIVSVSLLAGFAIYLNKEPEKRADTTEMIFVATLPLLGSWVGTVLAYYFSKENLEAATRSVGELSRQLTVREKLASALVNDKMIKKSSMFFKRLPANDIKITELLNEIEQVGKGLRVPILTTQDYPSLILHRSVIDRYLADKARTVKPLPDLDTLTIQNLLDDDSQLKKLAETSFGVVRENANLAEAKDIMDKIPNCQDVFVTASGAKTDVVIGWITDGIIRDNSKI